LRWKEEEGKEDPETLRKVDIEKEGRNMMNKDLEEENKIEDLLEETIMMRKDLEEERKTEDPQENMKERKDNKNLKEKIEKIIITVRIIEAAIEKKRDRKNHIERREVIEKIEHLEEKTEELEEEKTEEPEEEKTEGPEGTMKNEESVGLLSIGLKLKLFNQEILILT